jgi:predicted small lipoprotein YifL
MRLTHSFAAAVVALATLTACGTKTPLTLPPQTPQATAGTVPAAADHSNKAAEPRQ